MPESRNLNLVGDNWVTASARLPVVIAVLDTAATECAIRRPGDIPLPAQSPLVRNCLLGFDDLERAVEYSRSVWVVRHPLSAVGYNRDKIIVQFPHLLEEGIGIEPEDLAVRRYKCYVNLSKR